MESKYRKLTERLKDAQKIENLPSGLISLIREASDAICELALYKEDNERRSNIRTITLEPLQFTTHVSPNVIAWTARSPLVSAEETSNG